MAHMNHGIGGGILDITNNAHVEAIKRAAPNRDFLRARLTYYFPNHILFFFFPMLPYPLNLKLYSYVFLYFPIAPGYVEAF